jgi:aryl-alcohol dehydrogenase-like predicted oxidoreductase
VALRPDAHEEHLGHEVLARVQQLIPQADRLDVSVAGLALAWVLSNTDVTAALVAPRRPDQFTMIEEASRLRLDADQREQIAGVVS